ncbi:NADPH-dependent FMN reductase [Enteractinococcus coprophilus]|uniref:NAD(P)H-dependent FMN reductase n=1 Tax=Enteractinococcus coprophilus TaxID=1027633 RepID=A0A543A081_9MICC|nr:NAD(P)H-dependent oxidoreductase [Enteractinococcus coprophilus]TQL66002.1 NAD(P)H-dependent FMN reductase [Enteractinococcus coprophilus]
MKIGIINGSIRGTRNTEPVAKYAHEIATQRDGDFEYEYVDLTEYNVPLLTSDVHPMVANKNHEDPNVQKWSDKIDSLDAFIFVTPEYNHGVPGGFKNAVDVLGPEWVGKPVAFIGHGAVGGVRAIEQWRQIVANFSMPVVRAELNFNLFFDWEDGDFSPAERHPAEMHAMLDQLEELVAKHRVNVTV